MFNVLKFNDIEYIEPEIIKYSYNGQYDYSVLQKEILRTISRNLGISMQVNKKIYSISKDIWRDIIKLRSDREDLDSIFDLNKYYFIKYNDVIFGISDKDVSEEIDNLVNLINSYKNDILLNNYGVLQIKLYTGEFDDFTTVALFDIDMKNGIYRFYTGTEFSNRVIIQHDPLNSSDKDSIFNFSDFIKYNFKHEIDINNKISASHSKLYKIESGSNITLSVREVVDILKQSGIDVNDEDDRIVTHGLSSEDNKIIIEEFFRSFNMPYKSLKRLSFLNKSIKFNRITVDDILLVLSSEYSYENNNVTASTISRLLSIYYNYNSDSIVLKEELNI